MKIPVRIRPAFFLVAALIGFLNTQDFVGTLIWTGIIFVSVLFHEYGHAIAAVLCGRSPRIELVAFGGLTYHDGARLSSFKQFLIVLNGPVFGFLLFLLASLLLTFPVFQEGLARGVLALIRGVNLFWTVINLLPVLPLDGGQLMRITLEAFLGNIGIKYAFGISVAVSFFISLYFFLYQAFFVGALFFLLAFQSFDALRKLKHLMPQDTNDDLKELFLKAEVKLQAGQKEEALSLFEKLKETTKQGVLYVAAIHYLALLYDEKGQEEKSYDLLKQIQKELAPDGLCLLHKVAFSKGDYLLVTQLSGPCFQHWPLPEVALRSAYAHAALKDPEPAIGWLKTVEELGVPDLHTILASKDFDPIRGTEPFMRFSAAHKPS